MVSKEAGKCMVLSNSESDSDTGASTNLEGRKTGKPQVHKRNKALQVRFKDICEAQSEQRARSGRSISCKVTHRKYMTMPARRSIPNVTKSTGVQTSPDITKHYKTFPFERKKGNTIKHTALVEDYSKQNNGFLSDAKTPEDRGSLGEPSQCRGRNVTQTKALLHHTDDSSGTEDLLSAANCLDEPPCPDASRSAAEHGCRPASPPAQTEPFRQACGTKAKHKGLPKDAAKRQLPHCEEMTVEPRPRGTGPVAWNSLTRVESLGSPSARSKRKKAAQLNGQQSQTLPHSAKCSSQSQAQCPPRPASASASTRVQAGEVAGERGCPAGKPATGSPSLGASRKILPQAGDGDIKAQLQAMETMISSSQETIKVLLGVIQELEKGEAQREGLSYRTGQDTANCDTCRNSACIIYSVELDFKLQEDKLHPLMKRLCPLDAPQCPALPYSNEVFTSTPKRKSKSESKKHARWKLWFL